MQIFVNVILILLAYLFGSIPSAVWIGKIFYGVDVRDHGSGNMGSTNTFRVIGIKAGIAVFIIDCAKGWVAVNLIYLTGFYIPASGDYINTQLLLGIAAFIGHIFPVFAEFKGGKGVATLTGVILAIHPFTALIIIGLFTITLLTTKYVSLSSMVSGFSFPFLIIVVFETTTPSLVIFSLIIAILLLFTHQKNIERLLRKEESKANISIKRKSKKAV